MSYSGHVIYLFVAGFLDIKFLSTWAENPPKHIDKIQLKKDIFCNKLNYSWALLKRRTVLYQQENMWLRRNVLVSRGSSDFFTLLLRAWRKHCNSRASIFSAKSGYDLGHILSSLNMLPFCCIRKSYSPVVSTKHNHMVTKMTHQPALQPFSRDCLNLTWITIIMRLNLVKSWFSVMCW